MDEKLRVIIVDDEYLIRNLIKMKARWDELGMEVVGEASTADEALKMVDSLLPDIVFTDICMPGMNGIELSKIILEKYPKIKVLIITGYNEFEYARSCIKLGVSDFILKPINSEELMDSLKKVRNKIIEERRMDSEYHFLKAQILDKYKCDNDTNDELIAQIIRYINEHLEDKDLSLRKIADEFFISKEYLSKLFKEATSYTVGEYITKLRMEHAKVLLTETSLKGYQVGEKIGIDDPHYFSILFKKYTGQTVSEFRKKFSKKT